MRHFRKVCAACVLTLAISLSAFAGNMETTIVSPQPSGTPSATTPGNVQTGYAGILETTRSITATESVAVIAFTLVQSVLALA
jgi:hypothetical protein